MEHKDVLNETEAAQGKKTGHMRYVLAISLLAAIIAGFALFGA